MNYEIDHQKLSEQIFIIVRKVAVPAGLYIFLTFVLAFITYLIGFIALFGSVDSIIKIANPAEVEAFIEQNTLQILTLNAIVTILIYFLASGVYGMIHKSNFSVQIGLGDAFKFVLSKQGLKVLNVIILVQMVSGFLSYALNIAGFALVGFAIGVLIQFLTHFVVPAIYFENLGIVKSFQKSAAIVNQKPGLMFAFIFLTYMASLAGILFFGIGIIFTLPLNFIVAYCLYKHVAFQISY